ncbi:MAG: sodium:solute symporter [Planctomycetota bacterium]
MTQILAVTLVAYLVVILGLSFWVRSRIHDAEDYIVAGRRLPFSLATGTLLATWFGAGTLLATTNEVHRDGIGSTLLEPYGPGLCLILTGLFYAGPLWRARILTLQDFYREKFGRKVERVATLFTIGYLGWIAAQLVGVAHVLELFFGWDILWGILATAAFAAFYTLLGGMWSVTVTDFAQILLVVIGLVVLVARFLIIVGSGDAGDGLSRVLAESEEGHLAFLPEGSLLALMQWTGLALSGTIGLIASQDLLQRVFSSRSERVAKSACLTAGGLYLLLGSGSVILGLGAHLIVDVDESIVAALAEAILSPTLGVIFILMLLSCVLSTLDSALLAPASVLAHNLLEPLLKGRVSLVTSTRACVLVLTIASAALAASGEAVFALLESSYSAGIAPWLVLTIGMISKRPSPLGAFWVLILGLGFWGVEQATGWEPAIPTSVWVLVLGAALYWVLSKIDRRAQSV